MLIAKGHRAEFTIEGGRAVRGAGGSAILHDERSCDWPSDSVLVIGFLRADKELHRVPPEALRYFGEEFEIKRGRVELPPRRLSSWKYIGPVARATYARRGEYAGDYEHAFGRRKLFGIMPGNALPILYERHGVLRLDLSDGGTWDWRGVSD